MPDERPSLNFLATGVGSVPFEDVEKTCFDILERLPFIPFWPQFVKRTYLEDMKIQYSEGLPFLEIVEKKRSLVVSQTKNVESELATFYEHYMAQDIDYFAISENYAMGLFALLDIIDRNGFHGAYIKGQSTGPITFAAGITDTNGNSVLHNPEILEAVVRGVSIKALWQVRKIEKSGNKTIIFLDEPYLSGFGSAFTPIERGEVIENLRTVIDYLRENSETLIGIHCCGNTDWSMIIEAGPDIINFDASEYMDYFLLYPDDIVRFLKGGGIIAWGIIPTANFTGKETVEVLFSRLQKGLEHINAWGIDADLLAERSILTPACGMGTMTPEHAKKGMELLSQLSQKCRGYLI
jgi:methionine synthase II (cobalamin-independent)